jgi:hypothetical protein
VNDIAARVQAISPRRLELLERRLRAAQPAKPAPAPDGAPGAVCEPEPQAATTDAMVADVGALSDDELDALVAQLQAQDAALPDEPNAPAQGDADVEILPDGVDELSDDEVDSLLRRMTASGA